MISSPRYTRAPAFESGYNTMRFFGTILLTWLLLGATSFAAEQLPFDAPILFDFGFFKITNSMVAMLIVCVAVVLFAQLATRKVSLIPAGLQNFAEFIVESLENFMADILGKKMARKTFWFFGSVFIFILFNNWFGLIPTVGSLGHKEVTASGDIVRFVPWLRGANADVNTTLALSLIFFAMWIFWSMRHNGIGGFFSHIFVYHGEGKGAMKMLLLVIFFLVGFLEVISIGLRPLTLTLRLYGNIYAGENLLELMLYMGGWFGWLTALPFYFLELLVGFIQALVFTLLTAVFTSLMCEEGEAH